MRDPETIPQTKWRHSPNKETLDHQNKGHFDEDEKTSKRIQCPLCSTDLVADTTFCVCGAQQTHLSKEQQEQAQNSFQEGFAYIQALSKLEIRPQNLRGKTHGQSRAQKQCCKAKENDEETVTKTCPHWKHRREKATQLNCGKMGLGPNVSRRQQ